MFCGGQDGVRHARAHRGHEVNKYVSVRSCGRTGLFDARLLPHNLYVRKHAARVALQELPSSRHIRAFDLDAKVLD